MASKYGGVPVAEGSKFGGVPVDEDAPLSLAPHTRGSGPTERFLSNAGSALNPIPGISEMASEATTPGIGLDKTLKSHFIDPQAEQFHKAGAAFRGEGPEVEGMGLPGRISTGIGHGLAGMLPMVGPATANAAEQVNSGDVAGGLGSLTGIVGGVAGLPPVIRGAGRGLMHAAEPIAENAMGIRNIDRKFAREPGRAILDETTGVRPASVSASAGKRIGDLSNERNAFINTSTTPVHLQPSIDEVRAAITRGQAGNSDMSHLRPMEEQLTVPKSGFQGLVNNNPPQGPTIAPYQSPADALAIRQRFGNDFTKFDAARPLSNETRSIGNQAYGKLTDELHRAVPESAPLDKRISSLIPVRDAAAVRALSPGIGSNVLQRIGAKTGSMAAGAMLGREMGNPVAGLAAGAILPELVSNPTTQMIGARSLDLAGRGIQSPIGTRALQLPSLIKPRRQQAP